jgi:poly(hydroxyalkanoate) granule-associated protein
MTNLDRVSNTFESAEAITRKIWLAGLGAYGKSFEEMQSQYEKFNSETTRLFEELVAKGKKLESDAKGMVKEKTDVERRIEEVRKKVGLDSSNTEAKIDELSRKVDALARAINKIS